MKEELLQLQKEMKELRDLFQCVLDKKPLDELTLKRIFEEYFRNKEMLEELRVIRFSVIVGIVIAVISIILLLYLAE
jgi:uncharacterized membrane protein YkgB